MNNSKSFIGYIPHGINHKNIYKLTSEEELAQAAELKKKFFGDEQVDYVVLYNNRNIRRKMTGDVVLAFQKFYQSLPKEKAARTRLLLHTQPVDDNGTDLIRLIQDVAPDIKFAFSVDRFETKGMNYLYAISDVCINLASNEGFGLSTAEAIMAEKMVVANITGGLQDQALFMDDEGNPLDENIHYADNWGSNSDGRYKICGEWFFPCFPTSRSLLGSPPTPYIFDERCSWEDAAIKLREIYEMPREERERRGKLGRQFMLDFGFTAEEMCRRFIVGTDQVFTEWKPRRKFELVKA